MCTKPPIPFPQRLTVLDPSLFFQQAHLWKRLAHWVCFFAFGAYPTPQPQQISGIIQINTMSDHIPDMGAFATWPLSQL